MNMKSTIEPLFEIFTVGFRKELPYFSINIQILKFFHIQVANVANRLDNAVLNKPGPNTMQYLSTVRGLS